jgi:hypothetical protein
VVDPDGILVVRMDLLHTWKEGHNAAGEYPNKQKRACCFVETEGIGLSYFRL